MRSKGSLFAGVVVAVLFAGVAPVRAEGPDLQGWVWSAGSIRPVKAATDHLPLSDQDNAKGWVRYEPMSDEFEGDALDSDKWWPKNPKWLGRQPGFFREQNVSVSEGRLHLTMRNEEAPEAPKDKGYHTFTSAAVQSKKTVKYGYFEIKAKPMKSHGSSSFWFYEQGKDIWTEIDVFEIGGGAPGFENRYNMNVHVFQTPTEKEHWSKHGHWESTQPLADDYHVYGLEWDEKRIYWYFDGAPVRWIENSYWHQALTLNFDSETMPDWFGLPRFEDLPSTYSIEYVRAWKRDDDAETAKVCRHLTEAAKALFQKEAGMIEHTQKQHGYACEILWAEGGDGLTVRAASLLLDIGIPMVKQMRGTDAMMNPDAIGATTAKSVLQQLDVEADKSAHVCGIIANQSTAADKKIVESKEFKIVWDADQLVDLPGKTWMLDPEKQARLIIDTFKTQKGRELAVALLTKK